MSREYRTLECGCLVSCENGGGLIPCDGEYCLSDAFLDIHRICNACGGCLNCDNHQHDYQEECYKGKIDD